MSRTRVRIIAASGASAIRDQQHSIFAHCCDHVFLVSCVGPLRTADCDLPTLIARNSLATKLGFGENGQIVQVGGMEFRPDDELER